MAHLALFQNGNFYTIGPMHPKAQLITACRFGTHSVHVSGYQPGNRNSIPGL